MGICCSSTCSRQTFRFKSLVLAVYPPEKSTDTAEANRDALNKLRSYVSNNPDGIPRVCRKTAKLITVDLAKQRLDRVGVGVFILHDLIDTTAELHYYVSSTLELAATLLRRSEPECLISAADLLSVLNYQLVERHQAETSSRLIADAHDLVIAPLRPMVAAGLGSNGIVEMHVRYAAIVALGNIAAVVTSSLGEYFDAFLVAILQNLLYAIRDVEAAESSNRRHVRSAPSSSKILSQISVDPVKSVSLPMQADQKDAAYLQACMRALSTLMLCCTSGDVPKAIAIAMQFTSGQYGWVSRFAPEVFKCITRSLQRRTQQMGFCVCQQLCEEIEGCEGANGSELAAQCGMIRCVAMCVELVPLTGARPANLFDCAKALLHRPALTVSEEGAIVCDAVVKFIGVVTRQALLQSNISQFSRMLIECLSMLIKISHKQLLCSTLGALAELGHYFPELPGEEQARVDVLTAISPFLASGDELRDNALCVLASYISAVRQQTEKEVSGAHITVEAYETIRSWLSANWKKNDHTPGSIVATGNVICALIHAQKWNCVEWLVNYIFELQETLAPKGGANSLAWLHLTVVLVNICGTVLKIPSLCEYASDLLRRRSNAEPSELSLFFHHQRTFTPSQCGIIASEGDKDTPLQGIQGPVVTQLLTRATIAVYLQKGDLTSLLNAFQLSDLRSVTQAITQSKTTKELPAISVTSTSPLDFRQPELTSVPSLQSELSLQPSFGVPRRPSLATLAVQPLSQFNPAKIPSRFNIIGTGARGVAIKKEHNVDPEEQISKLCFRTGIDRSSFTLKSTEPLRRLDASIEFYSHKPQQQHFDPLSEISVATSLSKSTDSAQQQGRGTSSISTARALRLKATDKAVPLDLASSTAALNSTFTSRAMASIGHGIPFPLHQMDLLPDGDVEEIDV